MTKPINRCAQYLGRAKIPYLPSHCNELEDKLKLLVGKYVTVVYITNSRSIISTSGTLQKVCCERAINKATGHYTNEVSYYFKERHGKPLILTDGETTNETTLGLVLWAGTVGEYNRLNSKGYFKELLAQLN